MIGIDSQVQQRMDQFRGRPQDLMQQYQMSRELIDLLALQKLKSEKDSAARSMMMQMQQNPQTIAAQREAELMGRTQQEVAQQVGGIAQLAEARKQQNLQRMASGAQPPVRMAQGGIARFAGPEGSFVSSDDVEDVIRRVADAGMSTFEAENYIRDILGISPQQAVRIAMPSVGMPAVPRRVDRGDPEWRAVGAEFDEPATVAPPTRELSEDVRAQLDASVRRTPPPNVTTTVTPEPPRDTGRRQTEAFPVGGLDSLRESLSRYNTTPQRQADPALERQVATRMEPRVGDIRAAGSAIAADGLSLLDRPLIREGEFALANRPLIREGEFALANRPLIREGELALGRDAYNMARDGIAGIAGALANRSASPLLQRQVVTGMEPTVEDLRAAGNAIRPAETGTPSEQQDESESPPSLGERIASRIASEQRVTRIPEYIASAVSGQKAAADAAREYLARVPDAVADLFSDEVDMVPPSIEPVVDYLARVPGAVADLFTGEEPSPTPQAEPPAEPPPEQYIGVGFDTPAAAASRTPADLRAEEEARVREALGQEGIMNAYQDMIRRQQELAGRLQDPEQQRRERYLAALRGIARAGGIGYGGGSQAAEAVRRRQNALAQQLLDKEFGLTKEQLGAQLGIGKEALESGRGVYADANAMAREVFRANADMALEAAKQAAEGRISQRELVEMAAELTPPPTPGEDPEDYQERLRAAVTALGNMTLQLRTTILPLAGSTSPDDFEVQ